MGWGYKEGFGFALPHDEGRCSLCEKEQKNIENLVGGPVGLICSECRTIVDKWMEAQKAKRDWWRQCNYVEPAVKDGEGIGERVVDVEISLSEIGRILGNQRTTKECISEEKGTPMETSYEDDIQKILDSINSELDKLKDILRNRHHGIEYDHIDSIDIITNTEDE